MPKSRRPLYLLADGGHARLVEKVAETGAFRTFREMNGERRLSAVRRAAHSTPAVRSVQSADGSAHTTGREAPYRQAKAAFAGDAVRQACAVARERESDGLILVAPAQILRAMKEATPPSIAILGMLAKDLAKTPDHELDRWLAPLERAAARI